MTRRLSALVAVGAMLAAGIKAAAPAAALPLDQVVATIRDAKGHYRFGAASLSAADCSGLVSVAQSLAMGKPLRRWGDTRSLLAGRWPHTIPGEPWWPSGYDVECETTRIALPATLLWTPGDNE